MANFGEYRLTYSPSEWGEGSMDPEIKMSISAEANLDQMLQFFESFLRAAGYQIDFQTLTLQPDNPDQSFWEDDGVSFVGNTWNVTLGNENSERISPYIGSGLFGGEGEDHISFNPVRSTFGSNVVTFS